MKQSLGFTYLLLGLVIIIWAIAWPTSKIGLIDMPPIWFSVFRLCTGFLAMIIILLFQKKIKLPTSKDMPFIFSIGLLQMAGFLILINEGLSFVDAGRSAILVYTTPFLVTPIAVFFYQERLTAKKILGLLLGLMGIVLLFNPKSFQWHNPQVLMGNAFLLLAAVCWAIAMLHTRYGKWHSSSLQLIPWQLFIATLVVFLAGITIDPHPTINWTPRLFVMGLYNGIFATGFAYAAIIYVSQRLPVIMTSLLLLGVPILGLLSSSLWLGEKLTPDILFACACIVLGLAAIAFEKGPKIKKDGTLLSQR